MQLDARSDLYSLSLVLVEAVTGHIPFASDTTIGTLAARTQQPVVAPPEMGPLSAVVERAGKIDPGDRYPDAATMEAALADSIEALERPEPLVLPGVVDGVDPHPTQAVKAVRDATGRLFDQDAAAEAIPVDFVPIGATRTLRGRLGLPPLTAAQRNRQRRLVPLAVLVVLAVATALGTSALAQVGASGRASPGLVGLTQVDAGEAAQKAGMTLHVVHRASPDPKGFVVDQDPAPGSVALRRPHHRCRRLAGAGAGHGSVALGADAGRGEGEAQERGSARRGHPRLRPGRRGRHRVRADPEVGLARAGQDRAVQVERRPAAEGHPRCARLHLRGGEGGPRSAASRRRVQAGLQQHRYRPS